jgi:hypothetical protein
MGFFVNAMLLRRCDGVFMNFYRNAYARLRLAAVLLTAMSVAAPVAAQQALARHRADSSAAASHLLEPEAVKPKAMETTAVWSAWGGDAEFQLDPVLQRDLQLEISVGQGRRQGDAVTLSGMNLGSLDFYAPYGNFERFMGGQLVYDVPMRFERAGYEVAFKRLFVEPRKGSRHPTLQFRDEQGRVLFFARQLHVYTAKNNDALVIERMDVHLTKTMAELLGLPLIENQFIGELSIRAHVNLPTGALRQGTDPACATRPLWTTQGAPLDLGMIDMGFVQDRGQITQPAGVFEIITPSSTLKNLLDVSGADIPWYEKFSGQFPPFNNDQHPYLIWNMYRFDGERMEQIGVSGAKHAFITVNVNCTLNCGGDGNIVWPGCEDVYGIGNNDSPEHLGPRAEVNPRTGVFTSTGSFFDEDGDGVQDNGSDLNGENRMQVLRADMEVAGAQYFVESWYVTRDDSNIFNSMGFQPVAPSNFEGDVWAYPADPFQVGAVMDHWVPPTADPASGRQNVTFSDLAAGIGHLKLAVRTEDLGGGQWRYHYTLMNYDIEHGLAGLRIPGFDGEAINATFHDPDHNASNDWVFAVNAGDILYQGPLDHPLLWGTAFSFSFTALDAPPVVRTVEVQLAAGAPQPSVSLSILAPSTPERIFSDGFEG